MQSTHRARWLLSTCGDRHPLYYCLVVLGFVGTCPDLGLRFLLVDKPEQQGPVIQRTTSTLRQYGEDRKSPKDGDILIGMGPTKIPDADLNPIRTFVDFTRGLISLRGPVPRDGNLVPGTDPTEEKGNSPFGRGRSGDDPDDHQRLVKIEFLRPDP